MGEQIYDVAVRELVPFEGNARIGNVDLIAESLQVNGQYRPIVVRKDTYEILAGNHTWKAAKQLGWRTIKVTFVDVDAATAQRIVLVDNRSNDLAGYDPEALTALLSELQDFAGTGYDQTDLDALLASLTGSGDPEALTDPDDVPDLPATAQSRLGDVWTLGRHRLFVGDATGDLGPLMQGDVADLVLTDPPYNVAVEGGTKNKLTILNDKMSTSDFDAFLVASFRAMFAHARAGAPAYVFHADTGGGSFQRAFVEAGWSLKQVLVWIKNSLVLSRQDYHWQHEPCLYGWKPGAAHPWFSNRKQTTLFDDAVDPAMMTRDELEDFVRPLLAQSTVIREDRPTRSLDHPTMKPVALLVRLMENSTRRGQIVLDPFGGSGSTLIACQTVGRCARLVELDPKYADVILRRYMEHTGDVPTDQTGRKFDG